MFEKRMNIICGHYGSGKTNLSINLALDFIKKGEKVTLVDLDVVNPYFRSTDYTELLQENGIHVISPVMAGTTVDAPALTSEIFSIFENQGNKVIIDVGGDDVGASALGRFSKQIIDSDDFQMLYVINKFRKLVGTAEQAIELLGEIEQASRLKATGLVNNSHLSHLTTPQDIIDSLAYADEVSKLTQLPLIMTSTPKTLYESLKDKVQNLYPVDIIVTLPWADFNNGGTH